MASSSKILLPLVKITKPYTYIPQGQRSFPLDMKISEIKMKVTSKNKDKMGLKQCFNSFNTRNDFLIIYSGFERKMKNPKEILSMPEMPLGTGSDGKRYCEIPIMDIEDFSSSEGLDYTKKRKFNDCTLEEFLDKLREKERLCILTDLDKEDETSDEDEDTDDEDEDMEE